MYVTALSCSHTDDESLAFFTVIGALDWSPPCRMSNLRNGNVPCPYFCNIHVDFKIVSSRMSNLRNCPCHITNVFPHVDMFMSHVDFKKWPCRPVEFKGQGPVIVCHHPAIGEGKLPVEGQFQVISHPIKSFQGVVIRPVEAGDTISFFRSRYMKNAVSIR